MKKISELPFITSDFPDIFHWGRISGIILYQNFAYAFRLQHTLLFHCVGSVKEWGVDTKFFIVVSGRLGL